MEDRLLIPTFSCSQFAFLMKYKRRENISQENSTLIGRRMDMTIFSDVQFPKYTKYTEKVATLILYA